MPTESVGFTRRAARRIADAVRAVESLGDPYAGKRPGVVRNPPQQLFAVLVSIDGGSAGSITETCSWTYTVETDAGVVLGNELSPQKCRLPNVPYVETPDESWGAGFYDKSGEFVLWDANECPEVEDPCPEEMGEFSFVAPEGE